MTVCIREGSETVFLNGVPTSMSTFVSGVKGIVLRKCLLYTCPNTVYDSNPPWSKIYTGFSSLCKVCIFEFQRKFFISCTPSNQTNCYVCFILMQFLARNSAVCWVKLFNFTIFPPALWLYIQLYVYIRSWGLAVHTITTWQKSRKSGAVLMTAGTDMQQPGIGQQKGQKICCRFNIKLRRNNVPKCSFALRSSKRWTDKCGFIKLREQKIKRLIVTKSQK